MEDCIGVWEGGGGREGERERGREGEREGRVGERRGGGERGKKEGRRGKAQAREDDDENERGTGGRREMEREREREMCHSPRELSAALRYWSMTSTQGSSVVSKPREEMEESSRARLGGMGTGGVKCNHSSLTPGFCGPANKATIV